MAQPGTPGSADFQAELHTMSPRFVVACLLLSATLLAQWGDLLPEPSRTWDFALLLFLLAPVGLVLESWRPLLGRWYAVILLAGLIPLANAWFDLPGCLALMAILPALAAAFIGMRAAAAAAAGESILLLLLARGGVANVSVPAASVALVAIWSILGTLYGIYRPVYQLAGWSWEHFHHGQVLLEEARSRGSELKQALKDLAHANRQLALTNEKLAAARLAAEAAQKTKAAFVANVSHEFRTPLNMIVGLTEFVLGRPDAYGRRLPAALLEDLQIIRRNSEHLAAMINDVLDLSQVEAGRMALQKERVNLREVIERALMVVRPLLSKKGLELRLEIPADLPQVLCDKTRIRQVVVNLLSNAARFTDHGSITVRAEHDDQHVTVSVADTGPGIAAEEAVRLFEPFHQVSIGGRNHGGSGLGLSISKQFVELHDGRMWLESQVGAGSTFFFCLPVSGSPSPVARPERWIAEGWSWVERTSRATLPVLPSRPRMIVCDESGELHPLVARLDEVEFFAARDLEEATAELERCPAEAVLVNSAQPDGLPDCLERATVAIRDTPVIGWSLPPRLQRARSAGAIDFLCKPLTGERLQAALGNIGRPVQRVLLVEDDGDARQLFTRMLLSLPGALQVATATTAGEALDQMRSTWPDLILLDIMLPGMDGWQLLEVKRADVALRDLPVIIVSAQDPQDEPLVSRLVAATIGGGVPVSKLLRCSRALSALLLQPD